MSDMHRHTELSGEKWGFSSRTDCSQYGQKEIPLFFLEGWSTDSNEIHYGFHHSDSFGYWLQSSAVKFGLDLSKHK